MLSYDPNERLGKHYHDFRVEVRLPAAIRISNISPAKL